MVVPSSKENGAGITPPHDLAHNLVGVSRGIPPCVGVDEIDHESNLPQEALP